MTSSIPIETYPDAEYEAAHQQTFAAPKYDIPSVFPPGVTHNELDSAIDELISALGPGPVFRGQALAHYVDPYDVSDDDPDRRKVPGAAVTPVSLEELSAVLEIANRYHIPVWTFSRGKNLGYGGPAPVVPGSIALDLHRMNQIIEVNDELHYAVVEPGVTWADLYNYCDEYKRKVWLSTPSLGWGSVIGNTLDRGTGYSTHSTHHQNIAGTIRYNELANSPSAFISKFTFGPSVEGLFLQSNLGIVTKMSLWLAPQPEAYMACAFSMPELEDLGTLVDVLGPMRRDGLIPSVIWVGNVVEALSIFGRREEYWDGEGPIPDWRIKELQKEKDMGYWLARFGLYCSKRIVQAHYEEIEEILKQKAPTGTLTGHLFAAEKPESLDAKSIPFEHGNVFAGVPGLMALPLVSWPLKKEQCGKPAHGDYAPIIPSDGKRVLEWIQAVKPIFEESGRELVADLFMHERHIILMGMYSYDQQDPKEREAVKRLFMDLHEVSEERGYGMYRGHVQHMDLIADLNDFNDHAFRRFVEKIKDAVDPNGILSPGKQGIWPERYRHLRGI